MEEAATFSGLNYAVLIVYFAVLVFIGLRLSGKQDNTEQYFLAGRNMPWFLVAMSMFASLTSAISYIGQPGVAFTENIAMIGAGIASIIAAPIFVFLFYPLYRKLRITTSYEYIEARYGKTARFLVSGLFILYRLGYLGTVIYAPALALCVVTGIDLTFAILTMGALATAYTCLGGLAAVIYTDVVQFVILIGGAIWVAISLMANVPGGMGSIISFAQQEGHMGLALSEVSLFQLNFFAVVAIMAVGMLGEYGTDQITVQRMMSIKSYLGMVRAAITNSFFDLFICVLLAFVGLGLFAYFNLGAAGLPEGIGGDKVLPYYIIHALPNGVSGLIITAIFAAAMSTMDSAMNSLATVVVHDFVRPLRRVSRPEQQDVKLARMLTLLFGVFGMGVAFFIARVEHIFKACSIVSSLTTSPVLSLFLLGVLTRRVNFKGWLMATVVAIPVTAYVQFYTPIHWIYYAATSIVVCIPLSYAFSTFFRIPLADPEHTVAGTIQEWQKQH